MLDMNDFKTYYGIFRDAECYLDISSGNYVKYLEEIINCQNIKPLQKPCEKIVFKSDFVFIENISGELNGVYVFKQASRDILYSELLEVVFKNKDNPLEIFKMMSISISDPDFETNKYEDANFLINAIDKTVYIALKNINTIIITDTLRKYSIVQPLKRSLGSKKDIEEIVIYRY